MGEARGVIDIDIKGFIDGINDAKQTARDYTDATDELESAIDSLDRTLSYSVSGFSEISKGMLDVDKSTDTLEKSLKNTEEQTEKLSEGMKEVDQASKGMKESLEDVEKQTDNTSKKTKDYEDDLNKVKNKTKETKEETDKYKTSLKDIGTVLDTVGQGMKDVGGTLTASVTAPIIGAGVASYAMADNFEDNFAKVKTLADETVVPFDNLAQGVKDLSLDVNKSTEELNEALYQAISATGDTGNALAYVEQSAKLAVGGFTDTISALDAASSVMNAYGDVGEEAFTKISDIMITTQNVGKTTVSELASSLSGVVPTAAAMNVSFEQVGASLAAITAQGTPTSGAVTQLNSLFAELGKSGTKASDALLEAVEGTEYAGKGFAELSKDGVPLNEILALLDEQAKKDGITLLDMFGSIEAGKGALQIASQEGQKFTDALNDMEDSAGATNEAFGVMEETQNKLMVTLEALGIVIGDIIKPYIDAIIDSIAQWIEWLAQLDPKLQEQIVIFALVAAAIGPILLALGTLLTSVNSIITFITTLSTGLGALGLSFGALLPWVAAAIAIVAALWLAWQSNFNDIRSKTEEVIGKVSEVIQIGLETIQQVWNFVVNLIKTAWGENWLGIQEIARIAMDFIFGHINAVLDIIKNVFLAVQALISGDWDAFWSAVAGIAEGWLDLTLNLITNLLKLMLTVVLEIAGLIQAAAEKLAEAILKAFEAMGGKLKEFWDAIWAWIKEFWESDDKFSFLYNAGSNMINKVLDGLKAAFDTLKGWMEGAVEWILDKLDIWNDAEDEMSNGSTGSSGISGSYSNGIGYVPRDGYIAELHEGETVLTREEADRYRNNKSNGATYYITFNSPKKINEYEAARLLEKTIKDIERGMA